MRDFVLPEAAIRGNLSPFRAPAAYALPPRWLRGGHAQLLVGEWLTWRRPPVPPAWNVSIRALPGGASFRALVADPPASPPRGCVLIAHGLAGTADGPHATRLAAEGVRRGWRVISVEMRGAAGDNAQPRLYTAGDGLEFTAITEAPEFTGVAGPKVGIGISLGGGMLARWLAQQGTAAVLDAAVALSPTLHLPSCAEALHTTPCLGYSWYFARELGSRIRRVAPAYGRRAHSWWRHRTLRLLDEDFASNADGHATAAAYYAASSAHDHVSALRRPLLVLTAADDPFVPPGPLRAAFGGVPLVDLRIYPVGGHVGFLDRIGGRWTPTYPTMVFDALDPLIG